MAILTKNRAIKIGICFLIFYAVIVILFETLLGTSQPTYDGTMIITSFEEDGAAIDRVVARLDLDGQIYVAVNHWPRAWARRVQRNPDVQLTYQGETWNYTAVVLEGTEHDQGAIDFSVPFSFRFLTGFPPRYFFRFDPKADLSEGNDFFELGTVAIDADDEIWIGGIYGSFGIARFPQ